MEKLKLGRREFFSAFGVGAAAFAPIVSPTGTARADTESSDEKRKARYRESEEVKTFYRVNRYPS